jgi:hypothetical protein
MMFNHFNSLFFFTNDNNTDGLVEHVRIRLDFVPDELLATGADTYHETWYRIYNNKLHSNPSCGWGSSLPSATRIGIGSVTILPIVK